MENNYSKFLPLGSVVMLNGGKKRLMITGFCISDLNNKDVVFDYSGCLYPEGIINSKQTALFNHDQIVNVYHLGLRDQEEIEFKNKLNQIVEKKQTNNPVDTNVGVDTSAGLNN